MTSRYYTLYEEKYNNTKPIRGRSKECRPLGDRRRTWEVVAREVRETGIFYGACFSNTKVVMIAPTGDVHLNAGGWHSVTTADFINQHSPFNAKKQYGKVWVKVGDEWFVLPQAKEQEFVIRYNAETQSYYCNESKVVEQVVIDKDKVKEAREPVKELKEYVKNILKLGDGWIREALVSRFDNREKDYWRRGMTVNGMVYRGYDMRGQMHTNTAKQMYNAMLPQVGETDEQKYDRFLAIMCAVAQGINSEEHIVVRSDEIEYEWNGTKHTRTEQVHEYRYDWKKVVNRIDYIVKKGNDVTTTRTVETNVPMANLT